MIPLFQGMEPELPSEIDLENERFEMQIEVSKNMDIITGELQKEPHGRIVIRWNNPTGYQIAYNTESNTQLVMDYSLAGALDKLVKKLTPEGEAKDRTQS